MTTLKRVGYFHEMRRGDARGPSLLEARQAQAGADDVRIVKYLDAGNIYIATPGPSIDVLDSKKPKIASAHVMTDGVYSWPGDLGYYVHKYHVRLPTEFVAHMASNNWAVPQVDVLALQKTEDKAKWDAHGEDIARRLVQAHVEYDEPVVAAAREAREATQEDADQKAIRELYVRTGQKRTDETLAQAVAKMLAYFADRIASEAPDLGPLTPISQPLPSSDRGVTGELTFANAAAHHALQLQVETSSGKKSERQTVKQGTKGELLAFLRAPAAVETLIGAMSKLTNI